MGGGFLQLEGWSFSSTGGSKTGRRGVEGVKARGGLSEMWGVAVVHVKHRCGHGDI